MFTGVASPGATVSLYSRPAGLGGSPTLIGRGTAGASGAWSIDSAPLADGAYTIFAVASLPGAEDVVTQVLPDVTRGFLVIDTVGPRVVGTRFLPFTGRVETTFQDDRSRLAQASLTNPSNYAFRRVGNLPEQGGSQKPARFMINGVATTANLDPTAAQLVVATLNNNRTIAGGQFRYTVLSGGVADVAGNPLNGEFSGSFPTAKAGDFVADLVNIRRRVLPPLPGGSAGDALTSAGQRSLSKILTSFGNGRTSATRAAAQIARLPRRVTTAALPVAAARRDQIGVRVALPSGSLAAQLVAANFKRRADRRDGPSKQNGAAE